MFSYFSRFFFVQFWDLQRSFLFPVQQYVVWVWVCWLYFSALRSVNDVQKLLHTARRIFWSVNLDVEIGRVFLVFILKELIYLILVFSFVFSLLLNFYLYFQNLLSLRTLTRQVLVFRPWLTLQHSRCNHNALVFARFAFEATDLLVYYILHVYALSIVHIHLRRNSFLNFVYNLFLPVFQFIKQILVKHIQWCSWY